MNTLLPPHSKMSMPPPDFVWKSGSDVQALWRKYGWVPPSESMTPPPPEKVSSFTNPIMVRNIGGRK
jgi:hypothetical protein